MSKIEEMTVEQTDEVVGGTSDSGDTKRIQMSTGSTSSCALLVTSSTTSQDVDTYATGKRY